MLERGANRPGHAILEGPKPDQIVLVSFVKSGTRIKTRSRQSPDMLFVDLYSNGFARAGMVIKAPPQPRLILLALAGRFGLWVDKQHLIDMLWGDDPDGGPDEATKTLSVLLHQTKPLAALLGYRIESWSYRDAARAYPVISAGYKRSAA
jgi:hypothetical protein